MNASKKVFVLCAVAALLLLAGRWFGGCLGRTNTPRGETACIGLNASAKKAQIERYDLANKMALDHLQASAEAEREFETILKGNNIDLALANWLIAADIPEFQGSSRETYFAELDSLVGQVCKAMTKMQQNAGGRADRNDSALRCARFCKAIIGLGFAYREEFRKEDLTPAELHVLYSDPDTLCLAGLLRTHRGSCVSMPLIYLVIGQRLGMPVHLVTVGKHYFVRWEEPGFRMNIEPTIVARVAVTQDDSVYLEAEGMTAAQVTGSQMRNLINREVVGELFYTRSAYWANKGLKYRAQQWLDLDRAWRLAPDDPEIQATHAAVFNIHRTTPEPKTIEVNPRGKERS